MYPAELQDRAVRLVKEWREARGRNDGSITAIAKELGIERGTLSRWVMEAEVEEGTRVGRLKSDKDRIAELERDNRELRRANEILRSAATFFGAELDRQLKK